MSADYTQERLLFTVLTPLGKDKLLFKSLQGEEQLSGLFHFQVEMLSQSSSLDFNGIIDQAITIQVQFAPQHLRYFNGIVTRFTQAGSDARFTIYYAEIRPWLWQLTLTKNCRIFQNLTVPQIIQQVFDDLGFSNYRFSLTFFYEPRIYCVQYEETAFNFVSRLMEDEGLFYFFEHTEDKHVLVIADDLGVHRPCPGIDRVRYWKISNNTQPEDVITQCQFSQQVTTGRYAIDDFNFKIPRVDLKNSIEALPFQKGSDLRIYEYPAGFEQLTQGQRKVTKRIESHAINYQVLEGQGHVFSFTSGYQFTLTDHSRRELNAKYVLRWVSHSLSLTHYTNAFQAFPAHFSFRAPITTPKPKIISPQTAIVTGPPGEEIYSDQYGRIKVQFHWDQEGQYDDKSSCWVRVNQGWAGKGWGHITIPRIGQEVIVSFENGDPDRPIVTGAVYNGQQPVPYSLPAEQTKSTWKSNSSKDGAPSTNYNEIRFEDQAGSEELYIQAEKDRNELVKNNMSTQVKANQFLTVGQNQTETVGMNKAETIGIAKALTTGAAYQVTVGAVMNTTVALSQSEEVGVVKKVIVGDKFELICGKGKITVEKSGKVTIEGTEFLFTASGDVKINGKVIDLN